MKTTLQGIAGALGLFIATVIPGHSQTQTSGLPLVPPDQVPRYGAFFLLSYGGTNGMCAPAPCPPGDPNEPIYLLDSANGQYLVDDTSETGGTSETGDGNAMTSGFGMFGSMEDPGGSGGGDGSPLYSFGTNGLWLDITNVFEGLQGLAYLDLHNATDQVYAIWSATNLLTNWQVETEVWPTNPVVMPFTVPTLSRPNLFLRAEDWTGVTANGNITPLWWFWEYFGTTALSDTNLDSLGNQTLSYDYTHHLDPNIINFWLTTPNPQVNGSFVPLQVILGGGVPASVAVLVDTTNFAAAAWDAYNPNPVAPVGGVEGWHRVWVGLRGRLPTSQQTWESVRVKLVLTPPLLVITNPVSSVVSQPVIQLQGYCADRLARLTYSMSNAAGSVNNQPVIVVDQAYDTNTYEFTTNYFQAFDVRLAAGPNSMTLYATDLAGNTSVTNLAFTLDYSGKTNPPVLTLGWPQNGVRVGSSTFTCRGAVSDPTAQVAAQFVDTNGVTNIVLGRVGRDGSFWVENLPIAAAKNLFALTATDAVGNSVSTNIAVTQSTVTLTVDSTSMVDGSAQGTVSDPTSGVWVNGVQATNHGDGAWSAAGLGFTLNTTVVQARAIPSSDNGGNGSGGGSSSGRGSGAASEDQGNPSAFDGTDAEAELAWPDAQIYLKSYYYTYDDSDVGPQGTTHYLEQQDWSITGGGTWLYKEFDAEGNLTQGSLWSIAASEFPASSSFTVIDLLNPQYVYTNSSPFWGWPIANENGDLDFDASSDGALCPLVNVFHDHGQIQLAMVTGGAPGSTATELYGLSGGALAILTPGGCDPPVGGPYPYLTLPPQGISVGSLGNLDTNGFLPVALPDRNTVEVTPSVNGASYYEVSLSATKYQVHVYINGQDMAGQASTPEFCVGQKVTCQWSFDPPLPTGVSVQYSWVMQDDYVNSIVPPIGTNYSVTYVTDPTLRTNSTTALWWINSGQKLVGCTVTVGTGPQATTISRNYFVNVYRPTLSFTDKPPSSIVNVVENGQLYLSLGTLNGGDMNYTVVISSKYSGKADFTQLVNRNANNGSITQGGTSTGGQFWLDNHRFYMKQSDGSDGGFSILANVDFPLDFNDNPGFPDMQSFVSETTSIADQFKDYVIFRPNAGNPVQNIYVTLGIVSGGQGNSWAWSASSSYQWDDTYQQYRWTTPTGSITRPTAPDNSDTFPVWPNIYINP